ncbi:MAG: glycoside hydrolase family 65 protein [Spirochaetes bacterium]|nr:MAG: glycoside hydrolase family 65 protein [Spirochaetota bacterium]
MDSWKLIQKKFSVAELGKYETLFTLGNGNLGLRGNLEEVDSNYERGTYINGLYEVSPIEYGESAYGYAKNNQAIIDLVDGKSFAFYADGELLTTDKASKHIRELDFKKGVLTRTFTWLTKSGATIDFKIERLVSLVQDSTAIQNLEINVSNKKVDFEIISILSDTSHIRAKSDADIIDPRTGSVQREKILIRKDEKLEGTLGYFIHQTEVSEISLFTGMDHSFKSEIVPEISNHLSSTDARIRFKFKDMGGSLDFVKYLCYCHSHVKNDSELKNTGLSDLKLSVNNGSSYYFNAQESFLKDFWDKSDIIISGDQDLQTGLRFNLFHLLQSTGRNGKVSIAAKGLTGLGYEGHYFWDTEIYVLPYYIYTFPEIAKSLLSYRYSIIDKARERAKELSHKGVLFPWRTINGEEASAYFPAGTAQYHINADIAFGVNKYVKSTGDIKFLLDCGLEILIETARFWYDLGEFIPGFDGAFCIHEVTGPDEYTALVNNNLYTNIMARENLLYASGYLNDLEITNHNYYKEFINKFNISTEEIESWKNAASKMRIPYDSKLSLYAQDDAFLNRPVWDFEGTPSDKYPLLLHFHPLSIYRYQVIKQADLVMALFLQGKYFSLAEKKRNFDYYEKLTTGDSSLSACIQGIMGSELGYLDLAEEYLKQTALIDLEDLNGNVKDGVHTASMAGSWMSVVYGFAGMRDSGGSLCFSPRLPSGLDEISFKINYSGSLLYIEITKDRVVYKLLEGEKLSFTNYYDKIDLDFGEKLEISLVPKLRAVLIDQLQNGNTSKLVLELESAGIKCIFISENDNIIPPPDPELFLSSVESLKIRRWDCLCITSRASAVKALESAEMASLKVNNIRDCTLNSIINVHKEFSLNWNHGISY